MSFLSSSCLAASLLLDSHMYGHCITCMVFLLFFLLSGAGNRAAAAAACSCVRTCVHNSFLASCHLSSSPDGVFFFIYHHDTNGLVMAFNPFFFPRGFPPPFFLASVRSRVGLPCATQPRRVVSFALTLAASEQSCCGRYLGCGGPPFLFGLFADETMAMMSFLVLW